MEGSPIRAGDFRLSIVKARDAKLEIDVCRFGTITSEKLSRSCGAQALRNASFL